MNAHKQHVDTEGLHRMMQRALPHDIDEGGLSVWNKSVEGALLTISITITMTMTTTIAIANVTATTATTKYLSISLYMCIYVYVYSSKCAWESWPPGVNTYNIYIYYNIQIYIYIYTYTYT